MSVIVNICLLGFVPFEKSTFESFFKLAGRRDTVYKVVEDTSLAKIFLVNGDNASAASWVVSGATESQNALFVGKPDASGRWQSTAPKPIRLTTVLGLLDVMTPSTVVTPTAETLIAEQTTAAPKKPSPRPVQAVTAVAATPPNAPTPRQASVKLGSGSGRH